MHLTQRQLILMSLFLLLMFHFSSCQPQFPELWDWRERHRRRLDRQSRRLTHTGGRRIDVRIQHLDGNDIADQQNVTQLPKEEEEAEGDDDVPILNVTDEDSPYALIDKFFPDRELNHRRMENDFEVAASKDKALAKDVSPLDPKEVWLADGDLLVIKGGSTPDREGYDNPWKPLDDFEAPYREPKLPPPDFIPDDTGVGVPLPPEDDDIVSNTIDFDEKPVKQETIEEPLFTEDLGRIFSLPLERNFDDEENFIRQMENFHFIRYSDVLSQAPNFPFLNTNQVIPSSTVRPRIPAKTTPTAKTFSYSYQNQEPEASPLVAERPRIHVSRQTTTAATTTTRTSTTPKARSTTISPTVTTTTTTPAKTISPTNPRELTGRVPKSYPNYVNNPNYDHSTVTLAPLQFDFLPKINYGNRLQNQLSIETNEIGDNNNFPFRAKISNGNNISRLSTEQNRVRRRPVLGRQLPPVRTPKQIVPTIHQLTPRPIDNAVRRNGGRYVTYFQGNVGGKSWSYSYKL